jgi:hypothetical protein
MGKFKQLLSDNKLSEEALEEGHHPNIERSKFAGRSSHITHIGYGHNDVFHITKTNGPKSNWYQAVGQKTKKVFTGKGLGEISKKLREEVNEAKVKIHPEFMSDLLKRGWKTDTIKKADKERKQFAAGKREINRLKKQGK